MSGAEFIKQIPRARIVEVWSLLKEQGAVSVKVLLEKGVGAVLLVHDDILHGSPYLV